VALLPGKKLITLRGSDLMKIREGSLLEKIHSCIAVFMTLLSLNRYETILLMSENMLKLIPRKFHNKVFIHTDPLDFNKFKPLDKNYCRKKYFPEFFKSKVKLVLFTSINRSNPIKRYYLASNVVNFANDSLGYEGFKLVSAHDINHLEMCEIYNAVDIVLLTSTHEGWPNCIKEALACNIPFVSTDVSDLKLLELPNCYISNDSVQELAQCLINIDINSAYDLRGRIFHLDFLNSFNKLNNIYKNLFNT
jgi:glycosyltransferase involved in cell wall biosynthesis